MIKEFSSDARGLYSEEVTRIVRERPLLTHEQEIELGQKMEAGKLARQKLLAGSLTEKENEELQGIVNEGRRARDFFVESNLRLVIPEARRSSAVNHYPPLDLIEAGNFGLILAVDKYDWRKGTRFSTYAVPRIKREIRNALGGKYPLSLGLHGANDLVSVRQQRESFFNTNGFYPDEKQTAKLTGLSPRKVVNLLNASLDTISLDGPFPNSEDTQPLEETLLDANQNEFPEAVMLRNLRQERVEDLFLRYLDPRQARILRLRFGFQDGYIYTLKEIGEKYGLTRERIRQIIEEAFYVLKQPEVLEKLKQAG